MSWQEKFILKEQENILVSPDWSSSLTKTSRKFSITSGKRKKAFEKHRYAVRAAHAASRRIVRSELLSEELKQVLLKTT